MSKSMLKNFIIGIERGDKASGVPNRYRILQCKITLTETGEHNWEYSPVRVDERTLIETLARGQRTLENATAEKTETGWKLVGTSGSLDRFEDNCKQAVILEEMQDSNGKILGYKVAKYNGTVMNLRLAVILETAEKYTKAGLTPFANAIYVAESDGKAAHIRCYTNKDFLKYRMPVVKNKYAEERKEVPKENKTVDRSKYTAEQLRELELGNKSGLNTSVYDDPNLSALQMKTLRQGMQSGVDVRPIAYPDYGVQEMKFYICELGFGADIRNYLSPKYNVEQLTILSNASEAGVDISKLSNPNLKANEMAEIAERLENNIWKDEFLMKDGSWQ